MGFSNGQFGNAKFDSQFGPGQFGVSSAPVIIPPIAAGAIYDWDVMSLGLNNNDPVGAWVDSVGSISANGAGGVRPLYKTAISPKGKPVVRFDGVDDTLVGVTTVGTRHIFLFAAFRPASDSAGSNPLSIGAGYFWFTGGGLTFSQAFNFGIARRNGIDTAAFFGSGVFALYEFLFTDPPTTGASVPGDMIFGRDRTQPTYGAWDICRCICYPVELTGTNLTNTRANLVANY